MSGDFERWNSSSPSRKTDGSFRRQRRKYHVLPVVLWLIVIGGVAWVIVWAIPQLLKALDAVTR